MQWLAYPPVSRKTGVRFLPWPAPGSLVVELQFVALSTSVRFRVWDLFFFLVERNFGNRSHFRFADMEARITQLEKDVAATFANMRKRINDLEQDNLALKNECRVLYDLGDLLKGELAGCIHSVHRDEEPEFLYKEWHEIHQLLKFRTKP